MPTATAPNPYLDEKIVHPLDRLRSAVRRYTLYDGLLTAGLFVVLWFWLGLAVDFGLFKLTLFDWVLDAPKWMRVVVLSVLGLLLVALLVTRLAVMMTRTFSYPALALVLEKRYPGLLGDRLITAVELADVGKAKQYGFSEEMIRATIAEAREKVGEVPVDDVFNWRRLRVKGYLLAAKALGTLAVVYAGYALYTKSADAKDFGSRFKDVAGIWAERNLLLRNVPWPRRVHLELVGFPQQELRIGKDAPPPKVTARAFTWVIADRGVELGWRPLLWGDLAARRVAVDAPPEPKGKDGKPLAADYPPGPAATDLTADRVQELAADDPAVKKLFDQLDALAAKRSMARTLRKLVVPADVTLTYGGEKTRGSLSLVPEGGNVFSGEVAGLKETVRFVVRGEDFATRPRQITLVPPPQFVKLARQEYQPAYLYHPPPVGQPFTALKGMRQGLSEKPLSLTGDKSAFAVVLGTEFVLRGSSDKPLSKVEVRPKLGTLPGLKPGETKPLELKPEGDARDSFSLAFRGDARPTTNLEFEVVLFDDDAVTSARTVVVQVTEDRPPMVELAVEALRKQGNTYLVTPAVRVPFQTDSRVTDDTGLSKVDYVLTYSQVETQFFLGVQAQTLAGLFAGAPGQISIASAVTPAVSADLARRLVRQDKKATEARVVGRFKEMLDALGADTPELLAQKLAKAADPDQARVVREVKFQNPATDYFDLREAAPAMSAADPSGLQPRYRAELNVVATDANVETGPKTGQNLEPIRLLVVSEADLLMEISKDEETLIAKIDDALKQLREAQAKLGQTADRLSAADPPADVVVSAAVRAQDIAQQVAKAKDITGGVHTEYRRLHREAEVNRCSETLLRRYQNEIITPLQGVLDGAFARSEQAHGQFQSALAEGRRPNDGVISDDRARLADLIREMVAIRDKLGEVLSINKLRDQAQFVLNAQKQLGDAIARILKSQTMQLSVPIIGAVPPVELAKGEKKVVKLPIDWGVYVGNDPYVVKFQVPPSGGVKLPAELRVSDDKLEIEVEVTAGPAPGEFPVKVVPSVGDAVTVTFRVK